MSRDLNVLLKSARQSDRYLDKQEFTTGIISPIAFPNINIEVEKLLTVS